MNPITPQKNNPPVSQPQEAAEECSICLMPISKKPVTVTQCKHSFHKECLDTWLKEKNDCPVCRTTLGERTVAEQTVSNPINRANDEQYVYYIHRMRSMLEERTAEEQAVSNEIERINNQRDERHINRMRESFETAALAIANAIAEATPRPGSITH